MGNFIVSRECITICAWHTILYAWNFRAIIKPIEINSLNIFLLINAFEIDMTKIRAVEIPKMNVKCGKFVCEMKIKQKVPQLLTNMTNYCT